MSNKHHFKNSSSIEHCDYDDASNTMTIKFHSSDKEHRYADVPREIYEGLKAAESPGKFFHVKVRNSFKAS